MTYEEAHRVRLTCRAGDHPDVLAEQLAPDERRRIHAEEAKRIGQREPDRHPFSAYRYPRPLCAEV
jgi:hypothetical protein